MGLKTSNKLGLVGTFLIIIGIVLLLAVYAPIGWQFTRYWWRQQGSTTDLDGVATGSGLLNPDKPLAPVSFEFGLVIPKIEVNERVFPNIDSDNRSAYLPVLKKGVAHAKGSSLPDQPGPVFIFAHSSDNFINIGQYNAAFFLLNGLDKRDPVMVYYQGDKYRYEVFKKVLVWPDEVSQAVPQTSANI